MTELLLIVEHLLLTRWIIKMPSRALIKVMRTGIVQFRYFQMSRGWKRQRTIGIRERKLEPLSLTCQAKILGTTITTEELIARFFSFPFFCLYHSTRTEVLLISCFILGTTPLTWSPKIPRKFFTSLRTSTQQIIIVAKTKIFNINFFSFLFKWLPLNE